MKTSIDPHRVQVQLCTSAQKQLVQDSYQHQTRAAVQKQHRLQLEGWYLFGFNHALLPATSSHCLGFHCVPCCGFHSHRKNQTAK